ncbi:MAG: hypothetical protein A2Y78_08455 [Acidobacteria bacterium RBG_13_68_16]|nr:MAG: hypothetical protein A2Y78_08455 [Acidobacteria bacterium RBG_13_68_16]
MQTSTESPSIAPKLALARALRDLGLTARGAAMLACCDTSDASDLAEAIDEASPRGPMGAPVMAQIAGLLSLTYVEREGQPYLAPRGAKWCAHDDDCPFDLDLPFDATDDDLLADLEACNGYDSSEESYTVSWSASVTLVDAYGAVEGIELHAETTIEPDEPECADGHEHDWQAPHEVLGGLEENPGVWGNGGGVIIKRVCAHCGTYKVTNTWATDPRNGTIVKGNVVSYEDADEDSLAWVASLSEDSDD